MFPLLVFHFNPTQLIETCSGNFKTFGTTVFDSAAPKLISLVKPHNEDKDKQYNFSSLGRESQFKKVAAHNIDNEGSRYDFASVMHYPNWAFQKARGLDTIRAKPQHGNPVSKGRVRRDNFCYNL